MITQTVDEFIERFAKGTLGKQTKHGCWSVYWWGGFEVLNYTPSDVPDEHEIVAYRRVEGGEVLSNSNQLTYVGRQFAWGNEVSRWGRGTQHHSQEYLEKLGAVPIPFTLFTETDLDVRDFEWVVKPTAEDVHLKIPIVSYGMSENEVQYRHQTNHFSGGCVFAIGDDHYLFDIDRQEIDHGIFNPFITKLPAKVSSIEEAYDVLVPTEVRTANRNGVDVQRQGEFFFIKHSDECPVKPELSEEEMQILRFKPSRIGFGVSTGRASVFDDSEPFRDDEELTPVMQEYQVMATRYKEVRVKYMNSIAIRGNLGKSSTGSHKVEKFVKKDDVTYASGKISQERRQHADLILNGWYIVVGNTGTISWTISGDID